MVKNKKRILSVVSFVVSAAIFLLALAVFITSLSARSKNRPTELFGYSFAVVVTGSMYPEINIGDLIIVKTCNISQIEEGQNAVFMGLSGEFKDKCIVHKVIEVKSDDNGIQLKTKGVNNAKEDDDPVTAANFIGREVYHSATLGAIMVFMQNPMNWVYLLVVIMAISVLLTQLIKIIKHFKNKDKEKE